MNAPTLEDRVVVVRAGLTDETFGYDHWRAAQFSSPWRDRDALLVILKPDENATDVAARIGSALNGSPTPTGRVHEDSARLDFLESASFVASASNSSEASTRTTALSVHGHRIVLEPTLRKAIDVVRSTDPKGTP